MFVIKQLGMLPYQEAWELQKKLVKQIDQENESNQLLLLEHPHTVTMGRGAHAQNLLLSPEEYRRRGIEVVEIDRGGDVTYHGPGQLVGYPLFHLGDRGNDAHRYLRDLEEVIIQALAQFNIDAGRKEGYTGVWVDEQKVAAIGVKFNRGRKRRGYITSHGFALNVHTDLRYFQTIIPCGITQYGVSSLKELIGEEISMEQVISAIIYGFEQVFNWKATFPVS
jgi:lipoyl(octanoyl) transferase